MPIEERRSLVVRMVRELQLANALGQDTTTVTMLATLWKRAKGGLDLINPLRLNVISNCLEHEQVARRISMSDRSLPTMTPGNVEDFDVWVFEARGLVASVVPLQAPWSAAVENYQLDEPAD